MFYPNLAIKVGRIPPARKVRRATVEQQTVTRLTRVSCTIEQP